MSTHDHPPDRLADTWIVVGWFIGTAILAVCWATSFEDKGAGRLEAIAIGAVGATGFVFFLLTFYGITLRIIWHYTRRYPFARGDEVVVTQGRLCGKRGRVVEIWQGEQDYKVEFDTKEFACSPEWFRVRELRKVASGA
jgi:hypothetical protein